MRQVLQSVIEVITKCDRYYKVRRLLQSATVQSIMNEDKLGSMFFSGVLDDSWRNRRKRKRD